MTEPPIPAEMLTEQDREELRFAVHPRDFDSAVVHVERIVARHVERLTSALAEAGRERDRLAHLPLALQMCNARAYRWQKRYNAAVSELAALREGIAGAADALAYEVPQWVINDILRLLGDQEGGRG